MKEYKYILDGHNPVVCPDLMKWAKWFESADRSVKETEIGDVDVSTVFMGLDHNSNSSPPMLFQTMVFGGVLEGQTQQYSTWDEAEKGHEQFVEKVKNL